MTCLPCRPCRPCLPGTLCSCSLKFQHQHWHWHSISCISAPYRLIMSRLSCLPTNSCIRTIFQQGCRDMGDGRGVGTGVTMEASTDQCRLHRRPGRLRMRAGTTPKNASCTTRRCVCVCVCVCVRACVDRHVCVRAKPRARAQYILFSAPECRATLTPSAAGTVLSPARTGALVCKRCRSSCDSGVSGRASLRRSQWHRHAWSLDE